jgi:hypothetical protein
MGVPEQAAAIMKAFLNRLLQLFAKLESVA